ncbi:hypothetical protein KNU84_gp043 [Bacteriophage DSS3_VP1]|uniref:Uncharacterized protein n=1 Tax=Bacteriophage DSS3_VP1 TaxID=2664196 RepID=A0A7S5FRG4_9CAUD|nr:hypothetical protein KNU84_gp043 [Bacteriophage DSS3_VP1]QGH74661.1 hypothetical protein DSS3VP1_00093 [Bacteriophage DSS3_VP1]
MNKTYLIYEMGQEDPIAVCATKMLAHEFIDEYNKDGDKDVWYDTVSVIQYKDDAVWKEAL